ncbi:MAG TPA: MBL fold metallo-hydrolase, partial [Phototrophicaceae bacterium]|nr:MBL fold metallo-hydrolase [Phototrophicaceae bacterium]
MIRIHAIQTGIVQVKRAFIRGSVQAGGMLPFLGQLFTDSQTLDLPVYAWVIEHPEGVIVVDTGEIAATKINWITQSRFAIQPEEEIGPQLARLHITNRDIRQVVLTHWHGDHIGGREYFQAARVYLSETEYRYARQFPTRMLVPFPADYHPQPLAFQPEPVGPFTHSFPL